MPLTLLDVDKFARGLTPVTSTELKTKTGEPSPNGLFSEKIFGVEGSLDRSKRFSYFELNVKVIHPEAYLLLTRIDKRLVSFWSTEGAYSLDDQGYLVFDDNGVNGISEFIDMFPTMKLKGGTPDREKIVLLLKDANKKGTLFIDKIPIIPPDLRPMYTDENNNLIIDELNNVYLNIMRKAVQVKSVGKGSALYKLLNFYLQQAVIEHDKYIRKKISKKSGLIRANMLGKRVDFSGRAVITPGPDLKVNEVGIPLRMAVSLFQPFLVHYLLFSKKYPHNDELEKEIKSFTESELSVDTVNRVIKSIKSGDKIPPALRKLFFDATEIVMQGRVVLLKRDPVLHDGSYRAFYPRLREGDTIQLCTLQVGSFNADFDGDQMGVIHPLTKQAQEEARTKMMRGSGSKNAESVNFEISKEMNVGLYMLTRDIKRKASPIGVTKELIEKSTDPYIPVRYKGKTTTIGRVIFNETFPQGFDFIDKTITKKIVNGLIPKVIDKYGDDIAGEVFSKLKDLGFKFATITAPSFTLDMIDMPDSILRIKEKLKDSSPEEAEKLLKEAEKIMINHLKDTGLYFLIESGSGKGWGQPRQILVAKGIISDPKGNLLAPIKGSFAEGLQTTEFFNAASGSRKGMADRSMNTAQTGYFTRQLVYVLGPAEASPTLRDCGTRRTVTLRLTNEIINRLTGRYIIDHSKKIKLFNKSEFKIGDTIDLRTPIYCTSKKICHTCYGNLLRRHKTPYVGILAGAAIGERGTQLIMRTFHTGGAATIAIHDILQDIVDNDPLLTTSPKKYLQQDEDKLITLKPCQVTIDLSNYDMNNNIQIKQDVIWANHLLSRIEYDDIVFNLILDYPVNLKRINSVIEKKISATLDYTSNDIILDIPLQTTEIKEQVNYVGRLLGGKVVFKDPSHLIGKIMKVYGKISDLDLVHFEILISQVLRDRTNDAMPARLGRTWDPIMMNIKNTVFASGFIQGLAFENVNKAIETGLISPDDVEPTLLGKLATGEKII